MFLIHPLLCGVEEREKGGKMIKKYLIHEIPENLKGYINMCLRTKEDPDISIISDHYFKEEDFFFHTDIGIDIVERNLDTGHIYCSSTEWKTYRIPTIECTWLPTVNQIKDLVRHYNLFSVDDEEENIESNPRLLLRTTEERWLHRYIIERYNKIWLPPKKDLVSK